MATTISRDILNKETNARFWTSTGHRPGQKLDPKNPTDKAMMPVWMEIFRKVSAEADGGTLVTTYDRPEVVQALADAEIASTVAALHVNEAVKDPDPEIAQQHTAAAATAAQVVAQKLSEAAANQPPSVSLKVVQDAIREAAKTPPSPFAPAADQIAHAQMQNGNGQQLRPEQDPWDSRYVPPSRSPREQPPAQPSPREQPRGQPPREVLTKETNVRFWNRTRYKPGQKLDMSIAEDRKQSKIWMEIFGEVEREANEGRLTFTNPELAPSPGARPPSRPMPPMPPMPPMQPAPPAAMQPPRQPPMPPMPPMQPGAQRPMSPSGAPDPWWPGMQQPMQPGMQQPMPPSMQQPMPPGMQPGMRPMPPGMQRPMQQPGMQRPLPPSMQPGMQPSMQPGMQPGMQRPMQQPMPPSMQPGMQQPMQPPEAPFPTEGGPSPSFPTEGSDPSAPAEAGMSKGTIALIVLGLASAAGVAYAVTRQPAGRTVAFRPRAKSTMTATSASSAFPPSRGGRY